MLSSIGGRFADREFEKKYLDWVVTTHRELKLTGIVTYDAAKKPQLEQVFVSLRIAKPNTALVVDRKTLEDFEMLLASNLGSTITLSSRDLKRSRALTKLQEHELLRIRDSLGQYDLEMTLPDQRLTKRTDIAEVLWASARSRSISTAEDVSAGRLPHLLKRSRRVAILGLPGAGKSTLLQFIALTYARERAGDPHLRQKRILKRRLETSDWRVPIFISLAGIAGSLIPKPDALRDPSIVDAIQRSLPPDLQKEGNAFRYFQNQLTHGKCIVLLDGLDEVPNEVEFKAVARAVESLAVTFRKNQFVITSRIAGWRSGVNADFSVYYVEELTREQINTFIETWYSAVERNAVVGRLEDEGGTERRARDRRAAQKADDLKKAIRENPGIGNLATNPMLLSIVALVHRSLATLPRERSMLYAECSKILLEQWDISRGVRVDDTQLKLEQKESLMRRLAIAFHTGEIGQPHGGREASRAEVERIISTVLPALGRPTDEAGRLLQRILERSGLLSERKRDTLAFAHHTFQEYFAAQYIVREQGGQEQLLKPQNALSDWWREVILLYSGLLADSSEFLALLFAAEDDLCQQRLRLSAQCLGESVEIKTVDLRARIAIAVLAVRTVGEVTEAATIQPATLDYLIKWSTTPAWYGAAALATAKTSILNNATTKLPGLCLSALHSEQPLIRSAGLGALSLLPSEMMSEELARRSVALLADEDFSVRQKAVIAIGVIARHTRGHELAGYLVDNVLQKGHPARRASLQVLQSLFELPDLRESIVKTLKLRMSTKEDPARVMAGRAFCLLYSGSDLAEVGTLLDLLEDADIGIRSAATEALRTLIGNEQIAQVVSDRMARLITASGSGQRARAMRSCGSLGPAIGMDPLVSTIRDELKDKNSSVRTAAAAGLGIAANSGKAREIVAELLAAINESDDGPFRATALRSIGALALNQVTQSVKDALLEALGETNWTFHRFAAEAISQLGPSVADPKIIQGLRRIVVGYSLIQELKHRIRGLLRLPTPPKRSRTSKSNVRRTAIRAFGAIADVTSAPEIVTTLKSLVGSHEPLGIRRVALTAFASLAKRLDATGYFSDLCKTFLNSGFPDTSVVVSFAQNLPKNVLLSEIKGLLRGADPATLTLGLRLVTAIPNDADEQIRVLLSAALRHDDKLVRITALQAAGSISDATGDDFGLDVMRAMLGDRERAVQDRAWPFVLKSNLNSGNWR